MSDGTGNLRIAIDGGTTNTRARLLRNSTLIASAARPVGVRDVAMSGSAAVLHRAIAECIAEVVQSASVSLGDVHLICASGMLTSNVGLTEVPHVPAPAGRDELARQVRPVSFPSIAPVPIYLVPGVKSTVESPGLGNVNECDVLRGEESEAFGIVDATEHIGAHYLLLPGSHTKLLDIDSQSRIAASYTTMGGEIMQALAQNTILASSIDWPPHGAPDWQAVSAGAELARNWGLFRGGFTIRLADILAGVSRSVRTWCFVGLVAAMDWDNMMRWPGIVRSMPLRIGGREPLRCLCGFLAKNDWSGPIEVFDDSVLELAAARGACSIAERYRHQYAPGD